MRIALIVPGRIDRLTGGSIYDRQLRDYLISRGNHVDTISLPDLPYFAGFCLSIPALMLLAIARSVRRYDVIIEDGWIHPSLVLFNVLQRFIGRQPTVTIVHQLRSLEATTPATQGLRSIVERHSLRSAGLIITVSRYMCRQIEELVGNADIVVALPGCDRLRDESQAKSFSRARGSYDRLGHSHPGPPIELLFVGNVVRRKGLDHLINALSQLDKATVKLNIVGNCMFDKGVYRELRSQIDSLGLHDVVTFHGSVPDDALIDFYSSADVFVMPSVYEGYGVVFAEAMRAGLPIIAAAGGPATEIMSDGDNAIIVPPGDPCVLADAIRSVAADPKRRQRMGSKSRELASQLPTWQMMCETVDRHLQSL